LFHFVLFGDDAVGLSKGIFAHIRDLPRNFHIRQVGLDPWTPAPVSRLVMPNTPKPFVPLPKTPTPPSLSLAPRTPE
ncbi:MAG: hypothetical protein ACRDQ6_19110, partial [Pseudonocardiaceae bacterium]